MFARIAEVILTPERFAIADDSRRLQRLNQRREVLNMQEADLRQQAEKELGTPIRDCEWSKAKAYAEHKINWQIGLFGNKNGTMREPWYLAMVISETVQRERYSQFTFELMSLNRYTDEQLGVKKGQPVS